MAHCQALRYEVQQAEVCSTSKHHIIAPEAAFAQSHKVPKWVPIQRRKFNKFENLRALLLHFLFDVRLGPLADGIVSGAHTRSSQYEAAGEIKNTSRSSQKCHGRRVLGCRSIPHFQEGNATILRRLRAPPRFKERDTKCGQMEQPRRKARRQVRRSEFVSRPLARGHVFQSLDRRTHSKTSSEGNITRRRRERGASYFSTNLAHD
ncbi:hypothetical protein R3P38DRAFT_1266624 [Favolaschia claudopus]|uniref:Uncharacterized protein n=1 Tax=Favolaschia claudopus TaxID=2862362 RepID=A0AAW0B293_9AGAR